MKTLDALFVWIFWHYEIEHENHFILNCTLYEKERNDLFQKINKKYSIFENLSEEHKLLFLFSSIDPMVCKATANYVYNAIIKRKNKQ